MKNILTAFISLCLIFSIIAGIGIYYIANGNGNAYLKFIGIASILGSYVLMLMTFTYKPGNKVSTKV